MQTGSSRVFQQSLNESSLFFERLDLGRHMGKFVFYGTHAVDYLTEFDGICAVKVALHDRRVEDNRQGRYHQRDEQEDKRHHPEHHESLCVTDAGFKCGRPLRALLMCRVQERVPVTNEVWGNRMDSFLRL